MLAGIGIARKSHTRPGDDDLILVSRACKALELLEFEFFRTAWRRWYGKEPDDAAIEPGFVTYLLQQRAPGYVRQFAREVVARQTAQAAQAALPKDPPPLEAVGSAGILLMAMVCLSIIIRF